MNARIYDTSFLTKNFADFLYSASKNNQDFVQSLVAFWISNICYCKLIKTKATDYSAVEIWKLFVLFKDYRGQ